MVEKCLFLEQYIQYLISIRFLQHLSERFHSIMSFLEKNCKLEKDLQRECIPKTFQKFGMFYLKPRTLNNHLC